MVSMSGSIPEETITQIKERINIRDVVSEYTSLKKVGANHKGLCPFHSEKTPSFTVNEEKQIFHCFGCGAGGNVLTFLMKAGGMAFPEAVAELAKRAGITIPKAQRGGRNDKQEALYKINESAADFYHRLLSESGKANAYLKKRGLTEEAINNYKLGYGGDGWDSLYGFLSKKGASLPLAEELGLLIPKKNGGYYDRFRERIIFPIFDINGQVIAFGGRSMDGSEPKYLNSPESVLFKKSDSLYGLTVAKRWIKEADEALIVEGYMDLLSLHQAGIKNSIATLGTALTTGHLRLIRRLTSNVVTVFDADQAGIKATLRSLDLFLDEGIGARVLSMPDRHDPDTYIKEVGADEFRKAVKSSVPIMEFFIKAVSKERDTRDVQWKLKVAEEVLPYVGRVPNKIEQWHYIKILSELMGVKEELLVEELKKKGLRSHHKVDAEFGKRATPPETSRAEKNITCLALKYPKLREMVMKSGVLRDFQDEKLRGLAESLLLAPIDADLLSYLEDDEQKGLYLKLMVEMLEVIEPEKELEDCINNLKSYKHKKEKKRLRQELEEGVGTAEERLFMEQRLLMERRERHRKLTAG